MQLMHFQNQKYPVDISIENQPKFWEAELT